VKVGDRVTKPNVWKLPQAVGTVKKVAMSHVVVEWDDVFGDWHYTNDQAKDIKVIDELSGGDK
tara:strand:+ start:277 stop:465 length:189 start_codon:yes stop_codon:yes gene_type:complete